MLSKTILTAAAVALAVTAAEAKPRKPDGAFGFFTKMNNSVISRVFKKETYKDLDKKLRFGFSQPHRKKKDKK